MIFDKLFNKIKDATAKGADKSSVTSEKVMPEMEKPSGVANDVELQTTSKKQSKATKKNVALVKSGKKMRSRRIVHTHAAHHAPSTGDLKSKPYLYTILKKPVVTEKAATKSEEGVYIFFVDNRATKHSVKDAIELSYGVRPRKVSIAKSPAKKKVRRTRSGNQFGSTSQQKKAYVFLKKGDSIKLS